MIRQPYDLHMHTTYCDGKSSAEEMILAAINIGLKTVGLSGHSYTWFDESYCMSRENTLRYIDEVKRLREKYAGKIQVLLGTELDYWSEIDTAPYDYLIGSSHYVRKGDVYQDIDYYAELLMEEVRDNYDGDVLGMCEDYYAQMGNIVKRTGCDIIGHFDLITKFNERYALDENNQPVEVYKIREIPTGAVPPAEYANTHETCANTHIEGIKQHTGVSGIGNAENDNDPDEDIAGAEDIMYNGCATRFRPLIDASNPRYIAAWKMAIDQIFVDTAELRTGRSRVPEANNLISRPNRLEALGVLTAGDKPVFEINTGAISKGNRTTPYPAQDQIEYIRSKGGILIYSSDAHTTSHICYAFAEE